MIIILTIVVVMLVAAQVWQAWEFVKLHNTSYKNFALIKDILAELIEVDKSLSRSIDILEDQTSSKTKH